MNRAPIGAWQRAIRWVVAVGAVGGSIGLVLSDEEVMSAIGGVAPSTLLAVAVLLGLYYPAYATRFRIVLNLVSPAIVSFADWFRLMIVARFLNALAPQAGNVYRGMRLKSDHQVSYTEYVAAFVFFAWLDVLVALGLALLAIVLSPTSQGLGLGLVSMVAVVLIVVAITPPLFNIWGGRLLSRIRPTSRISLRIVARLQGLVRLLHEAAQSPAVLKRSLAFVGWSLVLAVVMSIVFRLLFSEAGVLLDLPSLAVFYVVYRLTLHINITPANIGIRELAYGAVGLQLGAPMAAGVAVSGFVRVISLLVLAMWGVALAGVGGLNELRRAR